MENKELYRLKIEAKINDIVFEEEKVEFILEGKDKISISSYHSQDCCEHVYADFDIIKYQKEEIIGKEFDKLIIKGVEGMGFLLCFYQDYKKSVKIFIPCYNEQNGYYSDGLELIINEVKININDFVEDNID